MLERRRSRSKDRAGKSSRSDAKHRLFKIAAEGQLAVLRRRGARGAIIDMTAGDGAGVPCAQPDLFLGAIDSLSTPELAISIARRCSDCAVFLCERLRERRLMLASKFGDGIVFAKHSDMLDRLCWKELDWVIVFDDPCGPSDHDVDTMYEISKRVPKADFISAFNAGWITTRLAGMRDSADDSQHKNAHMIEGLRKKKELYFEMLKPEWWTKAIGRKRISRTSLLHGSNNFNYHIQVVSDYLSDAVRRRPFSELEV